MKKLRAAENTCCYLVHNILFSYFLLVNIKNKSFILPVLYECDTQSLTISRSITFENQVLRKIFAPKRKEVGGGWRVL
jgi:hypothetical protein